MHRELVERKRWVSEGQYLRTLNLCMLLPGPEAQQVATYIGWRLHGVLGGAAEGPFFARSSDLDHLALSYPPAAPADTPAPSGPHFAGQRPGQVDGGHAGLPHWA